MPAWPSSSLRGFSREPAGRGLDDRLRVSSELREHPSEPANQITRQSRPMLRKTRALLLCLPALALGLLCYGYLLMVVLLPWIINAPTLRSQLEALAGQQLQAKVDVDRLQLRYFPYPVLTLHGLEVSSGRPKLDLQVKALQLAPDLEALRGLQLSLGLIRLETPHISYQPAGLPDSIITRSESARPAQKLRQLRNRLPLGFAVEVRQGRFELVHDRGRVAAEDLQARLKLGNQVRLDLSCSGDLWQQLSLELEGEITGPRAQASLRVSGLQAEPMLRALLPGAPVKLIPAASSLSLDLSLSDFTAVQGDLRLQLPGLRLARDGASTSFDDLLLQAGFKLGRGTARLEIQELSLTEPGLSLSGSLQGSQAPQLLRLDLSAAPLAIKDVRRACLQLYPELRPLRTVWQVVRDGTVTGLNLTSQGGSPGQLLQNLTATARLSQGRIDVPEPSLPIRQASGQVSFARGVLRVDDLKARLNQTRATSGRLELGLVPLLEPFSLSIDFRSNLVNLPDTLTEVVPLARFQQEMARLNVQQGSATGRFTLRKTDAGWRFNAQADDMQLTARHDVLPRPVRIHNCRLTVNNSKLLVRDMALSLEDSTLSRMDASVDWSGQEPAFSMQAGSSRFDLELLLPWLESVRQKPVFPESVTSLRGWLAMSALSLQGPVRHPSQWVAQGAGQVEALQMTASFLPNTLHVHSGSFSLADDAITLKDWRTSILDSQATVSGSCDNLFSSGRPAAFSLAGRFGKQTLAWAQTAGHIPDPFQPGSPIRLLNGDCRLEADGELSYAGNLIIGHGLRLDLQGRASDQTFQLDRCRLEDERSRASLQASLSPQRIGVSFQGDLEAASLRKLFASDGPFIGTVRGDMAMKLERTPYRISSVQGQIKLTNSTVRLDSMPSLHVGILHLREDFGSRLTVLPSRLSWNGSQLGLSGSLDISGSADALDLQMTADSINATAWRTALAEEDKDAAPDEPGRPRLAPLQGQLDLAAQKLIVAGQTLRDIDLLVSMLPDGTVRGQLKHGRLCSLRLDGSWRQGPDGSRNCTVALSGQDRPLGRSLACLFGSEGIVTGAFDLSLQGSADAAPGQELLDSLSGDYRFTARDGRIARLNLLAKIFALLNSTEILVGKLPDLDKEGFGYSQLNMAGNVSGRNLTIEEGIIDGDSIELAFRGPVHLSDRTLDLIVLASPLKTVDRLFKKIPIISGLLGGNLISIPIRVSGSLSQPTIVPLSPTAVGSEVFNILKRTIKLPVTIIQPLIPEASQPSDNDDGQGTGNGAAKD